MKAIQNFYKRFPIAGLLILCTGICIWAFSLVFLVVLFTVAFTG